MKDKPKSRPALILDDLKRGRELSSADIWYKYGVYRASSVIKRLRASGHNIACRIERVDGVQYGVYSLQP